MSLNLFAISPGVPFLDALARGWLHERGDDPLAIADGLILTPTRRAARALADAFLRVSGGRGLLLPRMLGFGALDEAPMALAGALDLPPAISPALRLATLTRLILEMNGAAGAPRDADRAWPLAQELAALMDEADRAEIDLARRLPDAADPAFAAHWERTLDFLRIVTEIWPRWLAEQGAMNPAARQVALLRAQAEAWEREPAPFPVVIAGTTAGIPAVARLARVVARMPTGRVVLPTLDTVMSPAAWAALDDSHPQAGLARLLASLDATREDVRPWSGEAPPRAGRFAFLSRALLPAGALHEWKARPDSPPPGLRRLRPRDTQEEAEAIAMILREAVETPARTAALVTPDRDLAARVSAALTRHGIVADDSAGETLADTPPAVFLRLLARAVADGLAPVSLMALLKHPFAAAGLAPVECRRLARALEVGVLRGPRPLPGLAGLRLAVADQDEALGAFLTRLEGCLEPALRMETSAAAAPAALLSALLRAAENLAATDAASGDQRLWAQEEGEALATLLTDTLAALHHLPDQRGGVLPSLLDALLRGQMVRTRRALRGRGGAEHPRVSIWGPLEARLQSVDIVVLGGLVETVWPPQSEPGPWLSRPMRAAIGLPSPEEAIGLAAHDFLSAAMAGEEVILSSPERRDGAPAVPARWLTRIEALLAGGGVELPRHDAAVWARVRDDPAGGPRPIAPPRPNPPVGVRPSRLSVTEIETWLRDPYAIYAKHILRLPVLDPLDQPAEAADYGKIVHQGVHLFVAEHGAAWPEDARTRMRDCLRRALAETFPRPALALWWEPRLERIADWIVETEDVRRQATPIAGIATEVAGRMTIDRPGRRFVLTGRADRIERRADGSLAILDYKTGQVPTGKTVEAGLAPQLPLEAAMAAAGAFGPEVRGTAVSLVYWQLRGGLDAGKAIPLFKDDPAVVADQVAAALAGLSRLIDQYDQPGRAYLAQPDPARRPRFADYEQLARVAEWSQAADEEEENGEGEEADP